MKQNVTQNPTPRLTLTESRVLALFRQYGVKRGGVPVVASALGCSLSTVRKHQARAYRALGVTNLSSAIKAADRLGFLPEVQA